MEFILDNLLFIGLFVVFFNIVLYIILSLVRQKVLKEFSKEIGCRYVWSEKNAVLKDGTRKTDIIQGEYKGIPVEIYDIIYLAAPNSQGNSFIRQTCIKYGDTETFFGLRFFYPRAKIIKNKFYKLVNKNTGV